MRQAQATKQPALRLLSGEWQSFERAAELGQPHQKTYAMVMQQGVTPEGIQAAHTLRLPVCLLFIKVSRASLAYLVGDGLAPG